MNFKELLLGFRFRELGSLYNRYPSACDLMSTARVLG